VGSADAPTVAPVVVGAEAVALVDVLGVLVLPPFVVVVVVVVVDESVVVVDELVDVVDESGVVVVVVEAWSQ